MHLVLKTLTLCTHTTSVNRVSYIWCENRNEFCMGFDMVACWWLKCRKH